MLTHLKKIQIWREDNDGLNSLEYGIRFINRTSLFTQFMIESRLLVPKTISLSYQTNNLIYIGTTWIYNTVA